MALADENECAKLQINVWLNEYQACHRNRNHYDSVRWTIGSIFIGASLTLFGFSLGVGKNHLKEVLLASFFSFFLVIIWYLYSQHVNSYVMTSILRLHEIEKDLRNIGYKITLHKSIRKMDKEILYIKGIRITFSLLFLVITMWVIRITFLMVDHFGAINEYFWITLFLYAGAIIGIYKMHKKFNPINWSEKIDKILEDC